MRYIVLIALLGGCVTTRSVERAQADSLSCWQAYRRSPSLALQDQCEQMDMHAQQLAARREGYRQAALIAGSAMRPGATNCTTSMAGNTAYTSCN